MMPEVGHIYYRKARSGQALVVRVLAVGEWVEYRVLHGPRRAMTLGVGRCKTHNFTDWRTTPERDDYSALDGCVIQPTYVVQDTAGTPILRCGRKRADFYLRKGFVVRVDDQTLRFIDDQTERRLRELYDGEFSAFFLAVKNDRCVACGVGDNLTRHHVVPRRHKYRVPELWRGRLSNVLFVCRTCHEHYESVAEPDPECGDDWRSYAQRWKGHFIEVLQPKFLPPGWDIVSVTNLDAACRPQLFPDNAPQTRSADEEFRLESE